MQVVQEAESRPISAEAEEQVAEKEVVEGLLSKAFHANQLATRSVSLVNLLDQPAVHVSGDTTVSSISTSHQLPSSHVHETECVPELTMPGDLPRQTCRPPCCGLDETLLCQFEVCLATHASFSPLGINALGASLFAQAPSLVGRVCKSPK